MKYLTLKQKDFDWINWNERDFKKEAEVILESRKKVFEEIKNIKKNKRNFKNTILPLERNNEILGDFFSKLSVLINLSENKKQRDFLSEFMNELSSELIEIDFDEGIYKALKEYKSQLKKDNIDGIDKKLFEDYFDDYKNRGFFLDKKEQKRLKEIDKKISKLSLKFSININNWRDEIELKEEELKGLPKDFIKNLKKEKDKYIVSTDYPELNPFIENSEIDYKREEILKKVSQKGGKENLSLLKKIIKLKKEKALLLRYSSYSDYVVKDRMAKKASRVEKFFNSLIKKTEKGFQKDFVSLLEYKKKLKKNEKEKLYPHDIAFLSNKIFEEKFGLKQEELRDYFPLERVKKEMFKVFSELFDFKIKRNKKIFLWSKEVEVYDIFVDGQKVAHLAFDLFPRKGKYGHAAMWDIYSSYENDKGKRTPAMAAVVCNFPKDTKEKSSHLSHYEIQVLFHEFGHALHQILSKARYFSHSGTSVAWDFVETPSQLLENWTWDKNFLKKISKHYETGKKISDEMIDKIIQSKNFMEGYGTMRQLMMTKFDFDIHFYEIKNHQKYWKDLSFEMLKIKPYKESLMPAGFGHIVGGYDSGYYSYLWALVYSDDIFSIFEKEGIYNKETGLKYRKEILEKGSEIDENKIVENFLGRKSNNKAFLKRFK